MNIEDIKKNAPQGATHWRDMDSICSPNEILYYCNPFGIWCVWDVDKQRWLKSIIHDNSTYILDQLNPL